MYYNEHTIIYFDNAFIKATEAKTDLYSASLHYAMLFSKVLKPLKRQPVEICETLFIPYKERFFKPDEIKLADTAFLCGTAAEMVPIISIDTIPFAIPWEDSLSFQIQKAYKHLVKEEDYSHLKIQKNYA